MICTEVREYLFAFLDNELGAPLSMDLQLHIEQCPVCAREVEIECAIGERLVRALKVGDSEIPLRMHTLRRTIERAEASLALRRLLPRHVLLAACAAVVFGVAVAAYLAIQDVDTARDHGRFVTLLVEDFKHSQEQGHPIQFVSTNARVVSDWLLRQTDLEVVLPGVKRASDKLLGARKCTIEGRPAAYVLYEIRGVPTSLVAIAGGDFKLDQARQIERDGRIHWVDHREGFSIVAYRKDNLVYAMVSKLDEQELIQFLSGAAHESD